MVNLLGISLAGIIILSVLGLLIIIVVAYIIGKYNSLVRMRNNNEEAFSTMDIYMKKRYDLIPNVVATVKQYTKHESETLQKVVAARNMAAGATSKEDKLSAEKGLQATLKSLFAVVENYPDLKADKHFIDLQNQLRTLENEIASARKYYNGNVKAYNTAIEVFPGNLIAGWFKFTRWTLFEITEPEARQNVKVEF